LQKKKKKKKSVQGKWKKKIETRMEILIAIAGKVVDYTARPVGRWLCYSFHYSSNIESMKKQLEKLRAARDRMQHSVDAAIRNGEEIQDDVKNWLKEADEIIEFDMKDFEGEEARMKCSSEACLNLKVRHQLSHKATKIMKDIGEILKNWSFDTAISYRLDPQVIVSTSSTDYMSPKSRMSTVKRLMEALRDDNIHVIGVWGMAGVGKSTLVRQVAKQAKEEKLFDEVAIANVTQNPDLKEIQREMADRIDLKFDVESSVIGKAIRLRERLTKKKDKKMILVILDDIWKNLDLEALGIPYEGCKVLLTSRNRDVLVSGMGTQEDFGLEVLAEEEAWSLFEKMAGDCVNKDPNMQSTATEVAKACSGLPLALVTVSKALKNKELFEWKDALLLLRRPAPEHLNEMQSTIYSSIEVSYKHLKETNKEARDVFLLCTQLGYYIEERDLLKYCCGLGLFHGINTTEDARNRLYTKLRILKDCCLLLPSSSESLRMHDVVRDAAILIASRDHNRFVVRADGGLRDWPDVDALKRCRAFSVLGADVHELRNKMECPELRFLYVFGDDRPLQISNTFFEGMGKLQVLDLTKMQLSALPSSLGLLRNLQTLCLDQCVLGDIAVIGELKNLAILSLLYSHISQLPREIGLLTRLQMLDLSNCSKLKVIPPHVLSSLVALEALYMENSFSQWEAEGLNNERNNANLVELKHLSHLSTLEIHIPDASNLPKDLLFKKLERYVI
jgi:Leucine-rich repeat (LRR) protein